MELPTERNMTRSEIDSVIEIITNKIIKVMRSLSRQVIVPEGRSREFPKEIRELMEKRRHAVKLRWKKGGRPEWIQLMKKMAKELEAEIEKRINRYEDESLAERVKCINESLNPYA